MSDEREDAPDTSLDPRALDGLLQAAWAVPSGEARSAEGATVLDAERYEGFERIGVGGMGVVFRAFDRQLQRTVALKVVRPPRATGDRTPVPDTPFEVAPPPGGDASGDSYAELTNRFLREAWLTGALDHPGVVPIYEMGVTPRGVPYYTMRYIRGVQTLERALGQASGADARLELLDPFLQVCDTVEYAHSCGVVHRDLKPANIGLGRFGEVMLLDWGLAKMREVPEVAESVWQARAGDLETSAGLQTVATALGTPGYMSPEAAAGEVERVDARSDVYSLGAILYRILTGRLPVEFRDYADLVDRQRTAPPALASDVEPSVSAELAGICARALSVDPAGRWSGAGPLAAAVRSYQRESRVRAEMRSLLERAETTYAAAQALPGDARLPQLDQARTLCDRVLARRPDHKKARALLQACLALRQRTDEERARTFQESAERERRAAIAHERARHRRERERLRRRGMAAAVVVLVLIAAGTGVAAWVLAGQRSEARDAELRNRLLLRELGVTAVDLDAARGQVDDLVRAQADRRADVQRLEAEAKVNEKQATDARNDLAEAKKLAKAAQDRYEDAKRQLQDRPAAGDREDPQRADLELTLAQAKAAWRAEKARADKQQGRADEATRDLEKAKADLETAKQQLADLRAQVDKLQGRLAPKDGASTQVREWVDRMVRVKGSNALRQLVAKVREYDQMANRAYVIAGLGRRGKELGDATQALLDLYEEYERDDVVQYHVLAALSTTGDPAAAEGLVKILARGTIDDRHYYLRVRALRTLSELRSSASLKYLLDGVNRWLEHQNGAPPVDHMEALRRLTGLPFEQPRTWGDWDIVARRYWRPTPLGAPEGGTELRAEGWRLGLARPDERAWRWSCPEGLVARVESAFARDENDAAWLEIRGAAAAEAHPREEGESLRKYEARRRVESSAAARELLPGSVRALPGATFDHPVRLAGMPGLKHEVEDPGHGAWEVYVLEGDVILYTVTVHHGPRTPALVRDQLAAILKSIHVLGR